MGRQMVMWAFDIMYEMLYMCPHSRVQWEEMMNDTYESKTNA